MIGQVRDLFFANKHGMKLSSITPRPMASVVESSHVPADGGGDTNYRAIREIRTYSVGWFNQGCAKTDDFQALVNQLDERLRVRFQRLPPIDFWFNASPMFQPPPWSNHVGTHEQDIASFVAHKRFKPWLAEVRDFVDAKEAEIADSESGCSDSLHIVLVCRAGRNRSVTGKKVLDHIFSSSGYMTQDDGFLSKPGWHCANYRVCSTCQGCTEMTPLKWHSLNKAFRIWNGL